MKFIIMGRQGGKTTELFEWLARGSPIKADYLGRAEPLWNRAIVTISEERKQSTKRFLQRWAHMHDAYRDVERSRVNSLLRPMLDAVYSRDEVHRGEGKLWNPMRNGELEFALDDAEEMLERYLGVPLALATFTGETYEREQRKIEAPIQLRRSEQESNVDEMLRLQLRKGNLSL